MARHRGIRRWRPHFLPILAALLAWGGLIVLVYPSTASWFSSVNQSKLIDSYSDTVAHGLTPPADDQLRLAHAYNDALNSGAILEAGERLPTGRGTSNDESLDYWSLLRVEPLNMMARIRIPSIDVDLPIFHGTSDDTLENGVGHLEGTSLPVGGQGTHALLTAHRGLANATMFTNLNQVKVGDLFTIEVMGQSLSYRVRSTIVVEPDEQEALRMIPGEDIVTLVTCTPLGINTQRILVTGERITPTPVSELAKQGQTPEIPGFPWWAVILAGGTLLVAAYVWYSGYPQKPRRRAHSAALGEPR